MASYGRLYNECSRIIEKLSTSGASLSLNNIIMASQSTEKRKITAIISHVLEYREILERVIDASKILEQEKNLNRYLALVLLHDFLIGGAVKCGGPLKAMVMRHKTRLLGEFKKLKVKMGVKKVEMMVPEKTRQFLDLAQKIPRHIRVNTNRLSVQKAIDILKKDFEFFPDSVDLVMKKNQFTRDLHLQELLVFGKGTDFHLHPLYLNGSIIIQEKSSCFPALALNPPQNSIVIDACAAPGNKTSHLSALMNNSGRVHAFDMDARRLKTLQNLAAKAGCTNIDARVVDFLEVDPKDYPHVEYILLDPSCSGSGIISRMDHLVEGLKPRVDDALSKRLDQLADFQERMILHAMTFPRVKRIVYSTCSIHCEENENVVKRVLEKKSGEFNICKILPFWKRRGEAVDSQHISDCVVRCMPQDGTNGFFVSCFERAKPLDFGE